MTGIAGAEANAPALVLAGMCWACGRAMRDGVPYAARTLPRYGIVQVGSRECANSPRFAHGFIAEAWLT